MSGREHFLFATGQDSIGMLIRLMENIVNKNTRKIT